MNFFDDEDKEDSKDLVIDTRVEFPKSFIKESFLKGT